jgi:hypothetical protein
VTSINDIAHILVGEGQLHWPADEQRGPGRYGCVTLTSPDDLSHVAFDHVPAGQTGHLVAEVLETRDSGAYYDIGRQLRSSIPVLGEIVYLGTGRLWTEPDYDGIWPVIGLDPEDGTEGDWMSPEALYRLVDQVVRLVFYPDGL